METAESIIRDALEERGAGGAEEPLEATDAQLAIRYLNRLMARFAAQGINLGFTKVLSLASPVTVPDGALDGIVKNLGVSLPQSFGGSVTPELVALAVSGKEAMFEMSVVIEPTAFSDTTPIGSGNEWPLNDRIFYPETTEQINSESNASIVVEDNTEDS